MSSLNVFIDGSWLFRACGAEGVLSSKTELPDSRFRIDFAKLDQALLRHVQAHDATCCELRERYLATSIFHLPATLESWPRENADITPSDIDKIQKNVRARRAFADLAIAAGYRPDVVYTPELKLYILRKLKKKLYHEKQVDTAVVALLVRSALLNPSDCHVLITGDADILPAIQVAYPEYSHNVFIATTHPDELRAEHRQTAWSLHNFNFEIEPFYLQDHIANIMQGENVYTCAHCHKVFTRPVQIPAKARPCCNPCHATRT
nr:hypothetical protein [Nitrospirota bacterium]